MAKTKKKPKDKVKDDAAAEPLPKDAPVAETPAPAAQAAPGTAETEQAHDQLLRLRADFENFRKRTVRERGEIYRRANEEVMEELLPVLDHMELALKGAMEHEADAAIVEGFRMVHEQLQAALGKHGLEVVDAEGQAFDPNLHEAIAHIPSPAVAENDVITQTRRGYRLGGFLVRAAQVVVSSGPPEVVAADADAGDAAGPESEA